MLKTLKEIQSLSALAKSLKPEFRDLALDKYNKERLSLVRTLRVLEDETKEQLEKNPDLAKDPKWVLTRILKGDKSNIIKELHTNIIINNTQDKITKIIDNIIESQKIQNSIGYLIEQAKYKQN